MEKETKIRVIRVGSMLAGALLAVVTYKYATRPNKNAKIIVQKEQVEEPSTEPVVVKKEKQPITTEKPVVKTAQKLSVEGKEHKKTNGDLKIVGQMDANKIEEMKRKKQSILDQIDAKTKEHTKLRREKGWHGGAGLRNEIELLKARLFWT